MLCHIISLPLPTNYIYALIIHARNRGTNNIKQVSLQINECEIVDTLLTINHDHILIIN